MFRRPCSHHDRRRILLIDTIEHKRGVGRLRLNYVANGPTLICLAATLNNHKYGFSLEHMRIKKRTSAFVETDSVVAKSRVKLLCATASSHIFLPQIGCLGPRRKLENE